MKIAITSKGNDLHAKFDLRFGRCEWFCIWDTESKKAEFVENMHKNANGGAGTKAVEIISELNAQKIISGDFGPKAKPLLKQFKIQMITFEYHDRSIEEILKLLYN